MESLDERLKSGLLRAGAVLLFLLCFFLFFKYLLAPLLPFLLALLLALAVLPLSEKLSKKTVLSSRFWAILLLALFSAFLFLFLWLSLQKFISELYAFVGDEKELLSKLENGYSRILLVFEEKFPTFAAKLNKEMIEGHIGELLSKLSMSASVYLARFAFSLPEAVLFAVVTVLAAYYFSLEGRTVLDFFYRLFPPVYRVNVRRMVKAVIKGTGGYFKAGGFMMILTFFEMLAGLSVLGFRYPFLVSLFIAAVDFLPVLGTGTVLVPWSILLFISGKGGKAIGLLILWLAAMLVRQLAEPRVMGKHLGIHPLVTLLCSYTGLKLFGIGGLVLLPIGFSVGWSVLREWPARGKTQV